MRNILDMLIKGGLSGILVPIDRNRHVSLEHILSVSVRVGRPPAVGVTRNQRNLKNEDNITDRPKKKK